MPVKEARDALQRSRQDALNMVKRVGTTRTRALLEDSERDLVKRLRQAHGLSGPGPGTFTATQLNASLAQVRQVIKDLKGGLTQTMLDGARTASEYAAEDVVDYLGKADRAFRGVAQPMALDEAAVLDAASEGARSSLLRRLASSGEPVANADAEPHPAKVGILDRYGMNTIGYFEEELQKGLLTGKSWEDMRADITAKSPFLEQAPASWAERIVRTECMGAYGKASWEGMREADDQLGDMLKIISSIFDDRTGADSYAVHGMIRRVDEAFDSWYGLFQHPPDRPNDRGVVVPHRQSWPIPDYLRWKTPGEVVARWRYDGRKGSPPPRPKMTTVPLSKIGK